MNFRLLLSSLAFMSSTLLAEEMADKLVPHSFTMEVTLKVGNKYLLTLPEGYDEKNSKKWPLLVFLHGAGERGDDLNMLRKHGPPKLIAAGHKFEAVVVCPQVTDGDKWNPHGVKGLVDVIKKEHKIDASRVYLTGISMGGFGTFETIAEYPDVFAAAVPICGGAGISVVKFGALKNFPIWIFHGAKDPAVPVAYSQSAYAWFQRGGDKNAKLTIYPDAQHDCWTETYENPEVWKWLFAQKR